MPITIGGGSFGVGQSYLDEMHRQRQLAMQQAQIDAQLQEAQIHASAQADAAKTHAKSEDARQARQEAMQQQFHGDEVAHQNAALAQGAQLRQDTLDSRKEIHDENLLQRGDAFKAEQKRKADHDQAMAEARTQALQDKSVGTQRAHLQSLGKELRGAADKTGDPRAAQLAQMYEDAAGNVQFGKKTAEPTIPDSLPEGIQGPLNTPFDIGAARTEVGTQHRADVAGAEADRQARIQQAATNAQAQADERTQRQTERETKTSKPVVDARQFLANIEDAAQSVPEADRAAYKQNQMFVAKGMPLPPTVEVNGTRTTGNKFLDADIMALGRGYRADQKSAGKIELAPITPNDLFDMGYREWQEKHRNKPLHHAADLAEAMKPSKPKGEPPSTPEPVPAATPAPTPAPGIRWPPAPAQGGPVVVHSQKEWQDLAPGTHYVDTKGVPGVKK